MTDERFGRHQLQTFLHDNTQGVLLDYNGFCFIIQHPIAYRQGRLDNHLFLRRWDGNNASTPHVMLLRNSDTRIRLSSNTPIHPLRLILDFGRMSFVSIHESPSACQLPFHGRQVTVQKSVTIKIKQVIVGKQTRDFFDGLDFCPPKETMLPLPFIDCIVVDGNGFHLFQMVEIFRIGRYDNNSIRRVQLFLKANYRTVGLNKHIQVLSNCEVHYCHSRHFYPFLIIPLSLSGSAIGRSLWSSQTHSPPIRQDVGRKGVGQEGPAPAASHAA